MANKRPRRTVSHHYSWPVADDVESDNSDKSHCICLQRETAEILPSVLMGSRCAPRGNRGGDCTGERAGWLPDRVAGRRGQCRVGRGGVMAENLARQKRLFVVGCLTSHQHAGVSQGRVCSDSCIETEDCRSNFVPQPVTVC